MSLIFLLSLAQAQCLAPATQIGAWGDRRLLSKSDFKSPILFSCGVPECVSRPSEYCSLMQSVCDFNTTYERELSTISNGPSAVVKSS